MIILENKGHGEYTLKYQLPAGQKHNKSHLSLPAEYAFRHQKREKKPENLSALFLFLFTSGSLDNVLTNFLKV
jgi:hypothetical protein